MLRMMLPVVVGVGALEEQAGSMAWPIFRVEAGYRVTDRGREGRRPELLAAEMQVDAAAAQVKAARAGHRPRVSVAGAALRRALGMEETRKEP